jgi:hypothetical protein
MNYKKQLLASLMLNVLVMFSMHAVQPKQKSLINKNTAKGLALSALALSAAGTSLNHLQSLYKLFKDPACLKLYKSWYDKIRHSNQHIFYASITAIAAYKIAQEAKQYFSEASEKNNSESVKLPT